MQTDNKPTIRGRWLFTYWHPQPIQTPHVNSSLAHLPFVERSAEVIRYSVLKAEYWISPNGRLREWLRLNVAAALIIGIPAFIVVPIITFALGQFATWMNFLAIAAWNLVRFVGSVLAAIALITGALMVPRKR